MSTTLCVVPVPGPAGSAGAAGTNGTNGVNAYTTTTASFTMPNGASGTPDVTINVVTNAWAAVNQFIFIAVGSAVGTFKVISKTGTTQMSVRNMEDGTGAYASNSAPGTSFASGASVGPSGEQGPAGAAGASGAPVGAAYITRTIDGTLTNEQSLGLIGTGIVFNTVAGADGTLSTLARGVANTNIAPVDDAAGLTSGEMLRATATGIESVTAATARTALGLVIGTNVQAWDAMLDALAALVTANDRYIYFNGPDSPVIGTITSVGRDILDDSTVAAQRATLGLHRSPQDILIYQHQLAAGTNAGTFTSGAGWQTVPLNTEVADTGSHGSIASNTITLATGVYRARWRMCGYQVGLFQSRLFNVTTASVIGLGSNAKSAAADAVQTESHGEARITISAATEDIRIEAQPETTGTNTGFGIANSFGGTQTYAGIWLEKEVG